MNRLIKSAERCGSIIAGCCLLCMMVLVGADAVARYLLGSPIPWVMETVSYYLMVACAYLAAADTFRHNDHIRLDLVVDHMPARVKTVTAIFHTVLALLVFAILTYASAANMIQAWEEREYIHGYQAWPMWLSYLPIMLGSALLALRLLHHAMTLLHKGRDASIELQGDL